MGNIGMSTALFMLKPILVKISNEIFASVITDENMQSIRSKLKSAVVGITEKTDFVWDDNIVDAVFAKLEDPEFYAEHVDNLLDPIEEWVEHEKTGWVAPVVMPAFKLFRAVANVPDND